MQISVLIPSVGRDGALARLLASLGNQTLEPNRFEVLVGLDGTACTIEPGAARVFELPPRGPGATRNALVGEARGDLVLFLNDDVIAEPDLLEQHARAHQALNGSASRSLVLGAAPWVVPEGDTLFDRMIRETSMVFFYDAMNTAEPDHDWGFRHAWTLNLSLRADLAREEPFEERLTKAMFEDIEWAWRLSSQHSARVLYRPEAAVHHDHRYTPVGYLERERALGAQALYLAMVNPACAEAIFRADVRSEAFYSECLKAIDDDQQLAAELEQAFVALATRQPSSCSDISALYDSFRSLKKHHWRQGLIAEAERLGLVSIRAA